jgi:hypothetical protein
LGRFITPDWSEVPVAIPYAHLSDPQTLNQYSYVRNIPTTNVDVDGHDCPTFCPPPTVSTPTTEQVDKALEGVKKATQIAEEGEAAAAAEGAATRAAGSSVGLVIIVGEILFPESVDSGESVDLFPRHAPTPEEMQQIRGDNEQQPEPKAASGGAMKGGGKRPYVPTKENLKLMKQGDPPIGTDGHKVELHHKGQKTKSPLIEMTRTQHRGKGNFKTNHQNTGQKPSRVDRSEADRVRKQHWKTEYKRHTGQ